MEPANTRISVPLTQEEKQLLRSEAHASLREPNVHARFLLRQALGLGLEARPTTTQAALTVNNSQPTESDAK